MDTAELRLLTSLEDRHWWYKERRAILARELRRLQRLRGQAGRAGPGGTAGRAGPGGTAGRAGPGGTAGPGLALDVGAAGGGNTRVLSEYGWRAIALEYAESAAVVARARGISTLRADARQLPARSASCGLVTAFDVLEHIDEDYQVAAEITRVLRPGGTALIAVPCDMALWSAHDDAVGHVRRYTRTELAGLVNRAGLVVEALWSWNVLLRPAVAVRRKSAKGSDLEQVSPVVNGLLTSVVVAERYLPVRSWPGVSLMLRARRPD
ncbi:MAG TPA: class I SAM-dependent methyltransferase [Streptosporangiaceae bacterium]|nr:class I SAM-dependent methyltransferase [Streptosporangiaceae bacterium]